MFVLYLFINYRKSYSKYNKLKVIKHKQRTR